MVSYTILSMRRMGSIYCKRLEQTRQSHAQTSGTLCQNGLMSNHVSISVHFRITVGWHSLAERRKTSRLTLLCKAINWLVAIPMDELKHTSRCTRHSGPDIFIIMQSRVDAYKFSFFPRTVTDWNSLSSSARSTPSVNSFKTALYTAYLASPVVITVPEVL